MKIQVKKKSELRKSSQWSALFTQKIKGQLQRLCLTGICIIEKKTHVLIRKYIWLEQQQPQNRFSLISRDRKNDMTNEPNVPNSLPFMQIAIRVLPKPTTGVHRAISQNIGLMMTRLSGCREVQATEWRSSILGAH